jgi:hypothetical protein
MSSDGSNHGSSKQTTSLRGRYEGVSAAAQQMTA